MELESLPDLLTRLADRDPSVVPEGSQCETLEQLHSRLEALMAVTYAAFESSPEWGADGSRSAAMWLATNSRAPRQQVRSLIALGRAVRSMPQTEAAWRAGEITTAAVHVLVPLYQGPTRQAFERDEQLLVDHARTLVYKDFRRVVDYWRQHHDPDGAEAEAAAAHEDRHLSLSQSYAGVWFADAMLDPISGAVVANELGRLEDELFEAEWTEARARLGRDPRLTDLPRTRAQRRADALVEMAVRSASTPAGAQRPRPLVTVLVDFETLAGRVCELANGTVLAPGSLLGHLEKADIERALSRSAKRVEVGTRARLFTGATRRAIEIRDRRCRHPYCDRPVQECQVDHIVDFARGGPTTQANGRLLCGYHNRLRLRQFAPVCDGQPPPDWDEVVWDDGCDPVEWGRPPPGG